MADGKAPLHSDKGASIGVTVVEAATDGQAYELKASEWQGLAIVCTHPFQPPLAGPLPPSLAVSLSRIM